MASKSSKKAAPHPSTSIPESTPILLPGEALVGHAPNTYLMLYSNPSPDESPGSIAGTLFVTNHRLAFIPSSPFSLDKLSQLDQRHVKSCEYTPLVSVFMAQTVTSGKRRSLSSKATMPKKISELEITCKDMRKFLFRLKNCEKSDALLVINGLGMYSSPSSIYHLFTFDYARVSKGHKDKPITSDGPPSFFKPRDWQKELDRLGISQKQWRITEANNTFLLCGSLPPYIVVPYNISDDMLEFVASLHRDNRLPVWCWSHPLTGVSLTRASMPDEERLEAPDPSYMYAVSMARNLDIQVENKQVKQFRLSQWCSATVKDIQQAYMKLQELCILSNSSDLQKQDQYWLQGLDNSRWVYYVRSCLSVAREVVVTMFNQRRSCLLLDINDRDISCVVSSLVQIMCDPHYRTITGFEALVQKEWVALGHPFTSRAGLVHTDDEDGPAPVFLLFCDCIWQLCQQFPSAFQFTEDFILKFYSLVSDCIYGNFVFDSAKDRLEATMHSKRSSYVGSQDQYGVTDLEHYEGPLVSAWDNWRSSFTVEENENWLNPFYYMFGVSDTTNCYSFTGSPVPYETNTFNEVFSDIVPNLTQGGNFGLYGDQLQQSQPPTEISIHVPSQQAPPTSDNNNRLTSSALLLPVTSVAAYRLWDGYFLRYLPEYSLLKTQRDAVRSLKNRYVKDVRKLKETLNDLEVQRGSPTSDLNAFIFEIMRAKEEEKRLRLAKERQSTHRMSAFASLSSEDEGDIRYLGGDLPHGTGNTVIDKAKTLPAKLDESLSKFATELYSNGDSPKPVHSRAFTLSTSSGGRSPVLKTKIKIQREDSNSSLSDPANRWIASNVLSPQPFPITPSPTITVYKKSSGLVFEGSQDELTDL